MEFRIADTFQSSLGKLTANEQKSVKTTAFDLQIGLSGNSTQFHKIERAKDPNFWSVRANSDIRLIVHKTSSSILICYVDHHDDAYAWARRRRIENHPVTGAAQIVEVRELVEDISINQPLIADEMLETMPAIFSDLDYDQLLSIGVPEDWIDDVLSSDEEKFLRVADHLPQEAAEILLEVASGDVSFLQASQLSQFTTEQISEKENNGFAHPDAQRRFRIVQDSDELALALEYPWEKWTVFLHPAQRVFAYKTFNGPARVSGSAGTGKTVVAIHRALALHLRYPENKILLTTFTKTLANAMRVKLERLVGKDTSALKKITVNHLEGVAYELMTNDGTQPNIASQSQIESFFKYACKELKIEDFSIGFLVAEWEHVVDAWQLISWEDYRDVKRLGRKTRIGGSQREKLWSIFDYVWNIIYKRKLTTWPSIFNLLLTNSAATSEYQNIIIDEAQDISVSELKFLAAVGGNGEDRLFFAGDLGQRIFRQPFSWKNLGVDVRGRSNTLKINYRTSHQIRQQADRLLPREISDLDENEESRKATISLFNSLPPQILIAEDTNEENSMISYWISHQLDSGIHPSEIGVFVRSEGEFPRAKAAITKSGQKAFKITDKFEENKDFINYGIMHLAKGLEFRCVAVIACDEDVLPQPERFKRVTDSSDLAEVYNTERHLLYVACTRARENLIVSGVKPASEFLEDLNISI